MPKTGATVRRTDENEPVGPKMHSAVVATARQDGYQSKKALAEVVGPNGSLDYGYRIVDRCLRRDLLAVDPRDEQSNPHGKGAVVLTDKGARYLLAHTDKVSPEPSEQVDADGSVHERRREARE